MAERAKERFSAYKMGYHLNDDDQNEDEMEDLYGEEMEMGEEQFKQTGGLSSFNLDVIQENADEDYT